MRYPGSHSLSLSPQAVLAIAVASIVLATAALPAAAQQSPMTRTSPNQFSPRDPVTGTPPPEDRLVRARPPTNLVVYRLPWTRAELDKNGVKFDQTLSQLCRRGRFGQRSDGILRVSMRDGWMGLAFSDGRNLKDDARVVQPGNAYLIDLQDTSNCTVRIVDAALIERYKQGGGAPANAQGNAPPAARPPAAR